MKTNTFILVTFLFCSACGSERSRDCQYELEGLCVLNNGHTIDNDMLLSTIAYTEQEWNKQFGTNLDLFNLIKEESLVLFVTDGVITCGQANNAAGCYWNDSYISSQHLQDNKQCNGQDLQFYQIVAHELLHFIIDKHMGKDSGDHQDLHVWINTIPNPRTDDNNMCNNVEVLAQTDITIEYCYSGDHAAHVRNHQCGNSLDQ